MSVSGVSRSRSRSRSEETQESSADAELRAAEGGPETVPDTPPHKVFKFSLLDPQRPPHWSLCQDEPEVVEGGPGAAMVG